jgi:hypothetical protein
MQGKPGEVGPPGPPGEVKYFKSSTSNVTKGLQNAYFKGLLGPKGSQVS